MPKSAERDAVIARVARFLKEERVRQELSINEVATRSGLSRAMVMRVEKRERLPTIDTLLRITGALDILLGEVISRAEKM